MRLALVGSFAGEPDEGAQKIASRTAAAFGARHEVKRLSPRELTRASGEADLASFRPDVIHVFGMPRLGGLAIARRILRRAASARLVVAAIHPDRMHLARPPFVSGLRFTPPDVVLVQSQLSEKMFHDAGMRVARCPNGVDAAFRPVDLATRRARKCALGLDPDRPVVLHVGHLIAQRKLERLLPLARECQLVVVASRHFPERPDIRASLERAGARVLDQFFPDMARVYQAADCYVFPVDYGDSLYQPLSVLEALACGLPVVAMAYPSLQESAELAPHVSTAADEHELPSLALDLARRNASTRCDVPTWDEVANRLEAIYTG